MVINTFKNPPSTTTNMESHEAQILRDLQTGIKLTQFTAQTLYGCARLASRICALRKQGFQIEKEMIEVPTRSGTGAKVAQYFMTPEVKPKVLVDLIGGQLAFL